MIQRGLTLILDSLRQRLRHTVPPRLLSYTVTFACNARCIMCDSWKMPPREELTLDDVERIFAQLPRLDAVRLTGGEPFVRRDLAEIADLASRQLRPLALHVTSNGLLTERIVRFCETRRRQPRLHLLISVDGVGDKHNQIRGNRLAWHSALETLQTIAPMQQRWNVRLAVNQTIVDAEGVEHYGRLRTILRTLGVLHQVVLAYETSATYNVGQDLDVAPRQAGPVFDVRRDRRRGSEGAWTRRNATPDAAVLRAVGETLLPARHPQPFAARPRCTQSPLPP
jgi:Fe-coproporphyrin III synthase